MSEIQKKIDIAMINIENIIDDHVPIIKQDLDYFIDKMEDYLSELEDRFGE